ncbi:MAG: hypothetical protein OXU83_07275, partial [Gammaproteobacteria bacterium]|nr:hypothetical protein [Gammaproteobacteria bacterium]
MAEGTTLTFTVVLGDGETPADETARVAWNISTGADALSTVTPQDFADTEGNPMSDFPGGVAVIERGSTSTTVSVATFNDNANEATETYTVTLGNPAGADAVPFPSTGIGATITPLPSTWTGVTRFGATTPTATVSRAAIIATTRTGAISDRADETVITIIAEQSRAEEGWDARFIIFPEGGVRTADITVPFTVTGDRADAGLVINRGHPADVEAHWYWRTIGGFGGEFTTRTWTVTTATAPSSSGAVAGGTLTISAATSAAWIILLIENDNDFELAETLHVRLGTPRTTAGGVRLGDARSASVVIEPSDRNITVGFVPHAANSANCETTFCARERERLADLCVGILSPASSAPLGDAQISLSATTVPGSAGTGDYTAINRRTVATLNDDNRRRCFTVALTDDASPETDETFRVNLATAQTAGVDSVTVAPDSATVTIRDNDIIRAGWAPFSRTLTTREGAGAVTLTAVILSPAADVPITSGDFRLVVNTRNRSAAAPGDFTRLVNHAITLGDTARSATVVIPIHDDAVSEMTTETFSVQLDFSAQAREGGNVVLQDRAVSAFVSITPSDPPVPEPMVNAGSDQDAVAESTGTAAASSATTVTLSGTVARNASDTGSTLTYRWEQVSEDSTAATVIQPGDDGYAGPITGPTGITDELIAT